MLQIEVPDPSISDLIYIRYIPVKRPYEPFQSHNSLNKPQTGLRLDGWVSTRYTPPGTHLYPNPRVPTAAGFSMTATDGCSAGS